MRLLTIAIIALATPVFAAPNHLFPEDGAISSVFRSGGDEGLISLFRDNFSANRSYDVAQPVTRLLAINQAGPFPPFAIGVQIMPNGRNPAARLQQASRRDPQLNYRLAGVRIGPNGTNRAWNYDPKRREKLERCEAPVTSERARRLSEVWDKVLFQTSYGNPSDFPPLGQSMWRFASQTSNNVLTGWTAFASGNPERLIEIGERLMDICERTGSEDAHWKKVDQEIALIR